MKDRFTYSDIDYTWLMLAQKLLENLLLLLIFSFNIICF